MKFDTESFSQRLLLFFTHALLYQMSVSVSMSGTVSVFMLLATPNNLLPIVLLLSIS